jgi:capsular polysaccharide transport system permease protein
VAHHNLREVLGPPGADFIARYPSPFQSATLEHLAEAYPRFVSVDYNSGTGISTLQVKAFRPQDAQAIAGALLDGGESVINRLNERADQDTLAETKREIRVADDELVRAETALTTFRNRERLIDPTKSSIVNLDLVGKLQGDIATMRAERAGMAASAPQNPQLAGLDSRIGAYQQQEQTIEAKAAGETNSLAPLIGEYEQLTMERDLAVKEMATAAAAAEQADLEARRKHLYLERISSPNLPDSPAEPHRWNNVGTTFLTLLLIYAMLSLVVAGFREHRR